MNWEEECRELRQEVLETRAERDTWKARAIAMFWKLPPEMTVGELQQDAERAMAFVQLEK